MIAVGYADVVQLGQAILVWLVIGLVLLAGWLLLLAARALKRLPAALDRLERILDRLVQEADALEGLGGSVRQAGGHLGEAAEDLASVTGMAAETSRKIQQKLADPLVDGAELLLLRVGRQGQVAWAAAAAAGRSLMGKAAKAGPGRSEPSSTTREAQESARPPLTP